MLIDLSIPINVDTPVYPGDPAIKIEPAGTLEKDGFQDHFVSFGNHIGTHIDAPLHMFAGGKNLDEIALEQFCGRGLCIDATDGYDLKQIQHTGIQAGDVVLFYTGTSDRLHDPSYYQEYPAVTEEVANYLVSQQVKMVGVDMGGVDHDLSIHQILLKRDVLILENLTNLKRLVGKKFKIYAFPPRFQLDAFLVRVVAEIPDF